ncbi:hypothetical protein FRC08_014337 [Ceratobasidium sp. 394]|nr:hypothetical protein FRC08_014337 [Ceratobasidium sp. 394]
MPSLAGFYVTHEDCREWVKKYRPDLYENSYEYGALPVIMAIEKLTEHRLVDAEIVGPPGVDDISSKDSPGDLMLVRRYSPHKVYISPQSTGLDAHGKELIEKYLDLKLSDWKVL